MFVRIAWEAHSRNPDPRALRRLALPGRRQCDDLGVPVRDFDKMTRSLFDRQD